MMISFIFITLQKNNQNKIPCCKYYIPSFSNRKDVFLTFRTLSVFFPSSVLAYIDKIFKNSESIEEAKIQTSMMSAPKSTASRTSSGKQTLAIPRVAY
ncbi:MAG: hypothetical protein IJ973_05595, partial [Christensenellaceae bacterium]|nr:hypothetical protein [Christensenellaceae bacterium]